MEKDMVSKDPEMQKSRQNAHFFLAVYALKPFNNIEDHFTVLWNNAPSTLKGEIVEYTAKMAKLVQIGG